MPFTIQRDAALLRITYTGALSGTELHASLDALEKEQAAAGRWPNTLADLRGVELSVLGFTDMMSVAKRREAVAPPNPICTALVAESPTVIGFCRMFQSLTQNPSITIQVFTDIVEAETWLQSQSR